MTKSVTCPEELGGLASQVTVDYGQLAQQGRLAAATAEPEEVMNPSVRHVAIVLKAPSGCVALMSIQLKSMPRVQQASEKLLVAIETPCLDYAETL